MSNRRSARATRVHGTIALVLALTSVLTGCAGAPRGAALYQEAEQHYLRSATTLHSVLMAIHEGEWIVPVGGFGAFPIGCTQGFGGPSGYMLSFRRTLIMSGADATTIRARAAEALVDADVDDVPASPASWKGLADDDALGLVQVTVDETRSAVEVSIDSPCLPGDAGELTSMITADDAATTWRSVPATEGPASVPQFYFPADAPLYFAEDGSPLDPQPVVTVAPRPPWVSPSPTR